MTTRIAILASGAGTNASALLDASSRGELGDAKVVAVLSDKAGCGALAVAARAGVEALFVDPAPYDRADSLDGRAVLGAARG